MPSAESSPQPSSSSSKSTGSKKPRTPWTPARRSRAGIKTQSAKLGEILFENFPEIMKWASRLPEIQSLSDEAFSKTLLILLDSQSGLAVLYRASKKLSEILGEAGLRVDLDTNKLQTLLEEVK